MNEALTALKLTVCLAAATSLSLLILATPLAWWLSRGRGWAHDMVTALVALPVVLPPTVLGFYLLVAMGAKSPLVWLLKPFGVHTLAFSFTGLLIGSIFYSLPFAVQPIRNAFASLGPRPLEVAATLRAGPLDSFFNVALPLTRKGLLTAFVLVFAHTVGEFGVVLMIGGAIPGKTETISIRIWQLVEQLDWPQAHLLAGGLLIFSFAVLLLLLRLDRRLEPAA
jgi:molybdate transport system permease protein